MDMSGMKSGRYGRACQDIPERPMKICRLKPTKVILGSEAKNSFQKNILKETGNANRIREKGIAQDMAAGLKNTIRKAVLKDQYVFPEALGNIINSLPDKGKICANELKAQLSEIAKGISK